MEWSLWELPLCRLCVSGVFGRPAGVGAGVVHVQSWGKPWWGLHCLWDTQGLGGDARVSMGCGVALVGCLWLQLELDQAPGSTGGKVALGLPWKAD